MIVVTWETETMSGTDLKATEVCPGYTETDPALEVRPDMV